MDWRTKNKMQITGYAYGKKGDIRQGFGKLTLKAENKQDAIKLKKLIDVLHKTGFNHEFRNDPQAH